MTDDNAAGVGGLDGPNDLVAPASSCELHGVRISPEDALELRLLLDWVKQNASVRYVRADCDYDRRNAHYEREDSMQTKRELRRGVEVLEKLLNGMPK